MNIEQFLSDYKKYFGGEKGDQLVFEMGEEIDEPKKRVDQVISRFKEITNCVLGDNGFWVILIAWDESRGTLKDLEKCGFHFDKASFFKKEKAVNNITSLDISEDDGLYYLYYNSYERKDILPLISAIAGYELGIVESANISAYLVSFHEVPILLNLYDDRGMELISNDLDWVKSQTENFANYYQK